MLSLFGQGDVTTRRARELYRATCRRARESVFYAGLGVPDTIDGRFDTLTLHLFLVMEVLKGQGEQGVALGEKLATEAFAGFEEALREMGIGDIGISRRIKGMANAFYGRLEAYSAALDSENVLTDTLTRNVYRGEAARVTQAQCLSHYVRAAHATLQESPNKLLGGEPDFGPLPEACAL